MTKVKKEYTATLGLLLITVWAALQYVFLQNIPDSVSTFSFMFITNLVGLVILAVVQAPKLKNINKKVLKKGLLLSVELIGFNFFMIIGSKGIESVIVSSLVSMYFVFVTPILLLLRKRVSSRSMISSVVAVIALLLMFNADTDSFFTSKNVVFLLIADIFFAAYVVSISVVGEEEEPAVLTISQMMFSCIFSFVGWVIEVGIGQASFSFPTDKMFWITVVFFGIFIRALYGLIQVKCQKHVKPVNASLIFSSEIIITLICNPFMSKLLHTDYTPATNYQIIGCVLFVIAVLVVDDNIMSMIGYTDMDTKTYTDENGNERVQSTLSKKLTNMTLIISMVALVIPTVICLSAISSIRNTAVDKSTELGQESASLSESALRSELENELTSIAADKAMLAEAKLKAYITSAQYAVEQALDIYDNPSEYPEKEVMYPIEDNIGIWAMQRLIADESIKYSDVEEENKLLGNMEGIFDSIIKHSDNISTIYIGTETGLIISYDPNSEYAELGVENYYEYRNSDWYTEGKQSKTPIFTKAYQDGYGRGLTITCVAPIYDNHSRFRGCIGIDILMSDINNSMVNDRIVDPNYATLIDDEGYIIASKDVDEKSSGTSTIFDEAIDTPLRYVAEEILSDSDGIARYGEGDEAIYISYSKIPLTNWTLCITSPVSNVIKPAITIRENIDTNTEQVASTVNSSILIIIENCLVLFAVLILIITYFVGKIAGRITDPLKRLETDVLEISRGTFDRRTQVSTDDEIGSLARAFNYMTESLQRYIVELKDITAREERIASELSVATTIQADMLPSDFPAFPERKEFDIYASMTPAKEVGGDFYDFFFIDDDHLALVIADVSGKGVPAALFMVIAKTLIKNRALMGGTPSEILGYVNNQLCEGNEAEMFVTTWLCIIELSTGKCTASNAGHEYPAIRRAGGKFELYKQKHSPALAVMEGIPFMQYEFELAPGDSIYVYTDGVAEATNSDNKLFGTDRMLDALNIAPDSAPEKLLEAVRNGIDSFIADAPQFDDITMLCLHYYGKDSGQ